VHVIATDGCFYGNGSFLVRPGCAPQDLEGAFPYVVFRMLKAEGRITDATIENMMHWHHSGFDVCCGRPIGPDDEQGLENVARYVIRASFSEERMRYHPACNPGLIAFSITKKGRPIASLTQ